MKWQYLQYEIQNGIALVTLNRPEKLNALNYILFKELEQVQKIILRDKSLRVVMISGQGGNFSAGLDIRSVMRSRWQALGLLFKWLPGNTNLAQRVVMGWQQIPIPVIAVIEGCCFGGGMQIALGADMRIAAPEARLSIMEAKWGLMPDMGGLAMLRTIMPRDQVLALTMTADVVTAEQAKSLGLVTRISATPLTDALALAQQLAARSPDALCAIKMGTRRNWLASERTLLARETWYQLKLLLGKNRRLAVQRQLQDKAHKPSAYQSRGKWS